MLKEAPGANDLTILTTEHATLQSARQFSLQDMQNRSAMFLTVVSASLVAIGFFGSASHFSGGFTIFVLALLTSLWVLGFLTFVRVVQGAVEDSIICFGLARIRHRYTEISPGVRELFVRSINDDFEGINHEMGSTKRWWQVFMPTYIAVSFVTNVLAGTEVAFAAGNIFHATLAVQIGAALVTFALGATVFRIIALSLFGNIAGMFPALYPSPSKSQVAISSESTGAV